MKFESFAFNTQWAAGKTQAEFLREVAGEGYKHLLRGDPRRIEKLKEVHRLCKLAMKGKKVAK